MHMINSININRERETICESVKSPNVFQYD